MAGVPRADATSKSYGGLEIRWLDGVKLADDKSNLRDAVRERNHHTSRPANLSICGIDTLQ